MLANRYKFNCSPNIKLNKTQLNSKKILEGCISSKEYIFEKVICAICQNTDFELLAEKDRYGLNVSTVICKNCGLVQTNPRMNQESYNKFYDSIYRKLYFGTEVATDIFFQDQQFRGKQILDFIEKNSPIPIKNKLVVEVGTGAGGILQVFKDNNNEVYGVDLGSEYVEFGKRKGLNLYQGTLADIKRKNIKPDLIIYSHVLEHILNPQEELELVSTLLNKDSIVYINVPGLRNLVKSYNQDFLSFLQNAHVYNFSLITLINLAQKAGLEFIAGNEEIQALFKVGIIKTEYKNDYSEMMAFLQEMEKIRRNPFNLYRMKAFIIESALTVLNTTQTYNLVRYLYRFFKKQ